MELPGASLDTVPDLPGGGRSSLSSDERVDADAELLKGGLDVRALGEAGAEEGSVDAQQDPRAALEDDGGEQQTDPEEDLKAGDDGHGGVVVLLHEDADSVSQRVGGLGGPGSGLGTIGLEGGLGGQQGGDQVGSGVGSNVEDGVDGVGQQGQGVLRSEQPNEGHNCRQVR